MLECEPYRLLRYSWAGGSKADDKYGSRLDSVVTWTLTRQPGRTLPRLEHDGFGPANAFASEAMSSGWARIPDRIAELAAALD